MLIFFKNTTKTKATVIDLTQFIDQHLESILQTSNRNYAVLLTEVEKNRTDLEKIAIKYKAIKLAKNPQGIDLWDLYFHWSTEFTADLWYDKYFINPVTFPESIVNDDTDLSKAIARHMPFFEAGARAPSKETLMNSINYFDKAIGIYRSFSGIAKKLQAAVDQRAIKRADNYTFGSYPYSLYHTLFIVDEHNQVWGFACLADQFLEGECE